MGEGKNTPKKTNKTKTNTNTQTHLSKNVLERAEADGTVGLVDNVHAVNAVGVKQLKNLLERVLGLQEHGAIWTLALLLALRMCLRLVRQSRASLVLSPLRGGG